MWPYGSYSGRGQVVVNTAPSCYSLALVFFYIDRKCYWHDASRDLGGWQIIRHDCMHGERTSPLSEPPPCPSQVSCVGRRRYMDGPVHALVVCSSWHRAISLPSLQGHFSRPVGRGVAALHPAACLRCPLHVPSFVSCVDQELCWKAAGRKLPNERGHVVEGTPACNQ